MSKHAIASVKDIEDFFIDYNNHNWEVMSKYLADDCIWDAVEKRMVGIPDIISYWTGYHASFKETLGKPEKVVFDDRMVYLLVNIHLEFIEEGVFFGKSYRKGETLDFGCADLYELNDEGKIKSGLIYIKFFN